VNPATHHPTNIQTYQIAVYDRALHPELFQLRRRRVVTQSPYELETWVLPGGHVLRFEYGTACYCELVTDAEEVPSKGAVVVLPCGSERDYDAVFDRERVGYMTTVQSEQLSENLYIATFNEMLDYAQEVEAVLHRWDTPNGRNMSMLDIQQFSREVHVQGYHLQARGGVVLRTQTIFECR